MWTSAALDRVIIPLKGLGSLVATAPSPADSGTSLVVTQGTGSGFPVVPFRLVVFAGADPSVHEIVNVTTISVDTFTIVRAQDGSTARSILVGDQVSVAIVFPVSVSTGATAASYNDLTNKPTLGTAAAKNIPASGDAAVTEVVYGTDTRLTNARTPSSHSHVAGDVTGTAVLTADARLSDARTPTAHASTHQNSGGDEVATATAAANAIPKAGAGGTVAIGWLPLGTTSSTVTVGNDTRLSDARTPLAHTHVAGDVTGTAVLTADARLSDARTPTSHAASHKSAGGDAIILDELKVPTVDVTTLDATTSVHGLLPKLGGGTANFLRADGTWAAPPGGSPAFVDPLAWS